MVRALLVRGMLAGALAGLIASGFAWVFAEPQIDLAIAFERLHQAHADAAEPELVSRAVQSSLGLVTGLVVYGSALGGIFALAFAYAYGRIGELSARATAALLAVAGFITLILVPEIKYPANPPAVGDPETIGPRTTLYLAMIALSLITAVAASSTGRQLVRRFGVWNASIMAGAAYLLVVALGMLALPSVAEVPAAFPATTLWNFRLAALGIQLVMWTTLGLAFGALAERLMFGSPAAQRRAG